MEIFGIHIIVDPELQISVIGGFIYSDCFSLISEIILRD